jgi:hypothetical protein
MTCYAPAPGGGLFQLGVEHATAVQAVFASTLIKCVFVCVCVCVAVVLIWPGSPEPWSDQKELLNVV